MPFRDNTPAIDLEPAAVTYLPDTPKPIRLRCRLGIHAWGARHDEADPDRRFGDLIHQRRRCLCCNITERSYAR